MKKMQILRVFICILLQLILLMLSFFFIFGFFASFEYPFPNKYHFVYFCLLISALLLFTLSSTSLEWHKKASYFIAIAITVLFFLGVIEKLLSPLTTSINDYLYIKLIELRKFYHDCQFQIGKLIAKLIGES